MDGYGRKQMGFGGAFNNDGPDAYLYLTRDAQESVDALKQDLTPEQQAEIVETLVRHTIDGKPVDPSMRGHLKDPAIADAVFEAVSAITKKTHTGWAPR